MTQEKIRDEGNANEESALGASSAATRRLKRLRQFICSRCGRLGCLDLICHGGVDV